MVSLVSVFFVSLVMQIWCAALRSLFVARHHFVIVHCMLSVFRILNNHACFYLGNRF